MAGAKGTTGVKTVSKKVKRTKIKKTSPRGKKVKKHERY
jgi:hypothetical protein